MSMEQQGTVGESKLKSLGVHLKETREAKGLDRKEVALQLRLNEKIIIMMEHDRYPQDLPITFIKGYLKSYSKLLHIPERDIQQPLSQIKPKPHVASSLLSQPLAPVNSSNYVIQIFTYFVFMTVIGLVGAWWYIHPSVNLQKVVRIEPASAPPSALLKNENPAIKENTIVTAETLAQNEPPVSSNTAQEPLVVSNTPTTTATTSENTNTSTARGDNAEE
jgi:cytoskeleton protein RodZ